MFADMVAGFDSRAITPRILVDAAGEWAYVYVQQGGALRATRVALAGEVRVEPLTDVNESVVPVGIDGARLLAIRTSHTRPADLVVVDTKTGQLQAVTGLNGTWLTGLPFDVHHPHLSDHRRPHGDRRLVPGAARRHRAVPHGAAHPRGPIRRPWRDLQCRQPVAGRGWLRRPDGQLPRQLRLRRRPRGNAHRRLGLLRPRRCAPGGRCGRRARLGGQHPGRLLRALQRRLPNLLAAHPQRPIPCRHLRVPRVGLDRHARLRPSRVGRRQHGQQPGPARGPEEEDLR